MTKPYEPDDPSMLVGRSVPGGDFDAMAAGVVEEFVRLGMDDAKLWQIFRSPIYQMTHSILTTKGERYVQDLIDQARAHWGYPQFNKQRGHNV